MSQLPERIRSLGHTLSLIVTGLAAGPRAIFGKGKDDTEAHRRFTEAASGREGDELPWRHDDAARRETATGEAEQAREEAAGRPAADTPEGAKGPADAAQGEAARPDPTRSAGARPAAGTPEDATPAADAAPEAAAPQALSDGMPPADVRRMIGEESRRLGDSPRGASPMRGPLDDAMNQVVKNQAIFAQQLLQLSDQAGAAWRAAREVNRQLQQVNGQLQQVNRNALKR